MDFNMLSIFFTVWVFFYCCAIYAYFTKPQLSKVTSLVENMMSAVIGIIAYHLVRGLIEEHTGKKTKTRGEEEK